MDDGEERRRRRDPEREGANGAEREARLVAQPAEGDAKDVHGVNYASVTPARDPYRAASVNA
jgi:hypothetical protein